MSSILSRGFLLGRAVFKSIDDAVLKSPGTLSLPDNDYWLQGHKVEAVKLDRFHRLVHWPQAHSPFLHPCYPQILAFPLHLQLLTQTDFPFKLLGLVHISNEIQQVRAISRDEKLDIRAYVANIAGHRLGLTFELVTEVWIEQQRVWCAKGTNLFRCENTGNEKAGTLNVEPAQGDGEIAESWQLDSSLGRLYAKVSGDYNPIHLYPISAKLLGFKRHIAHGMCSKSRCLSALATSGTEAFNTVVKFQKPIFLPSKVNFLHHQGPDSTNFSLKANEGGESHLSGTWITL
jgi:hypothetical protein